MRSRLHDVMLPPSTSGRGAIDFARMESGYTTIADSINNLAYTNCIQNVYEINADIVRQVERRSELVRDRGSVELIGTYDQTIMDLQNERNIAREYK